MSNYDFTFSPILLEYVRLKAKSFLENHCREEAYGPIEQLAQKDAPPKIDCVPYINIIINETIKDVANHEGKDLDTIYDEFCKHYLSKE